MEHSGLAELPRGLLAAENLRQIAVGSHEDHDTARHMKTMRASRHGGSGLSRFLVSDHSPSLNVIWSNFDPTTTGSWNMASSLGVAKVASAFPVVHEVSQSFQESQEPKGLPKVFLDTCQRWGLGMDEQLILLGFERGESIGTHVLEGRVRTLSRDATARAGYVIAISVGLAILYGENIAAESRWLRRKRDALGGQSPLDLMLGGDMISLVDVNGMVERERGI